MSKRGIKALVAGLAWRRVRQCALDVALNMLLDVGDIQQEQGPGWSDVGFHVFVELADCRLYSEVYAARRLNAELSENWEVRG